MPDWRVDVLRSLASLVTSELSGQYTFVGRLPLTAVAMTLLACSSGVRSQPNASSVAKLCPGSALGETADGLPNLQEASTSEAHAQGVLKSHEQAFRSRYANVTNLEIGPGFGRAWDGTNGGAYTVVPVRDFAIIVHMQSQNDCPVGETLFATIERVPLFFASP